MKKEISKEELFDIISMAKTNFVDQKMHLYWDSNRSNSELCHEEKRVIAIIEAMNVILKLEIGVNYEF